MGPMITIELMPTTTIQIETEVRDRLKALGRMGESYNDVIRRLLATARPVEMGRAELKPPGATYPTRQWVPMRDRD